MSKSTRSKWPTPNMARFLAISQPNPPMPTINTLEFFTKF